MNSTRGFSEDRVTQRGSVWGLVQRLIPYGWEDRWEILAIAVLVILSAALQRLVIAVFGMVIDRGMIAHEPGAMARGAIAYLILQSAGLATLYAQNVGFARVGNRILHRLRVELMAHTQRLPMSVFDRTPVGRIVTRLTTDVTSLSELFNQGLMNAVSALITMLSIVVAMAAISLPMTLITLSFTPLVLWACKRVADLILDVQGLSKKQSAEMNSHLAEVVSGITVLQLFNWTSVHRQRFQTLTRSYCATMLRSVGLYAILFPLIALFSGLLVVSALSAATLHRDWLHAISTGSLIAFILHARAFADPLKTILERYQLFQNSVSSSERIFALLDQPIEMAQTHWCNPGPEGRAEGSLFAPIAFRTADIAFDNVSFRYQDGGAWVLKDIDLSIRAGTRVGLVGQTGSGKSTLVSLLQRFYEPVNGVIRIGPFALNSLPASLFRRRIGVVQQDVFLFRGTIAENISMGDSSLSRERLQWAFEEVGLRALFGDRRGGIDGLIDERGANLSVGEKQLVAFARLLAFDPDVLILDEATAHIDHETERLIQRSMERVCRGRTTLIIAHRLQTITDCDRVIVMSHGRIVEDGAPNVLIACGKDFAELTRAAQMSGEL